MKVMDVTIRLKYDNNGLSNTHSFNYWQDLRKFDANTLANIAKGSVKFNALDKAVNGLIKLIDGLKCSFHLHIYATVPNAEVVQSTVELSLVPPRVIISTPGKMSEVKEFTFIRDGREEVKAVLRKEVKKIKGLYKAAALEALAEKAKKAEAK